MHIIYTPIALHPLIKASPRKIVQNAPQRAGYRLSGRRPAGSTWGRGKGFRRNNSRGRKNERACVCEGEQSGEYKAWGAATDEVYGV
eukprot:1221394-Amorphochlora_amoeboformis.AAC.2